MAGVIQCLPTLVLNPESRRPCQDWQNVGRVSNANWDEFQLRFSKLYVYLTASIYREEEQDGKSQDDKNNNR